MPVDEEEYELVPLSPLRKIESRLSKLEKVGTSNEMLKELVDIVRTNQQIVDDIVKINSDIVGKITQLTDSVNKNVEKIEEFLGRIEVAGEHGESAASAPAVQPSHVDERLDKLEKRINALILSAMARGKFRPTHKKPA